MRDSVTGRGYYKPESSRFDRKVRKTLFAKRQPRRDRNVRTPFREKTKEHGTERVTGAELRKRTRFYRCQQLGHMARECQNQASKDDPQAPAKSFFMPRDAFAQLHNLSSFMAFTVVSETLDGSPDKLENESDWDTSNDEPELQDANCKPRLHRLSKSWEKLSCGSCERKIDSTI